jgi:hypothetical protein
MKATIHIKLVNGDFSQSIADDFYEGDASEDNVKYLWEDELFFNDIDTFKINNNAQFELNYAIGNDNKEYLINNLTIIEGTGIQGVKQVIVSKKIIKTTNKITTPNNDVVFEIILKDNIDFYNPTDGMYIISTDFPKELQKITQLASIIDEDDEQEEE